MTDFTSVGMDRAKMDSSFASCSSWASLMERRRGSGGGSTWWVALYFLSSSRPAVAGCPGN